MRKLLEEFFDKVLEENIELYNEFSFQHELGIYFRSKLPNEMVQFERNVSHFNLEKSEYEKKEIDISIFSDPYTGLSCVIELKYPRNGQVPETMYSFCKDISFLEQLVLSGFNQAYFVAIADDPLFYSGSAKGIYGLFRSGEPITGNIRKPTGAKDTTVTINGSYTAVWTSLKGKTKYCIVEVRS